jgi:hypothetical protein
VTVTDVTAFGTVAVYVVVPLEKTGLSVPALNVRALRVVTALGVLNVPTLE